jgi:hypothetical protein
MHWTISTCSSPIPRGVEAAEAMVGIFSEVITADVDDGVRTDAVDNLLLYLQQIIGDSRDRLPDFLPVLDKAFNRIHDYPDDRFFLFAEKLLSDQTHRPAAGGSRRRMPSPTIRCSIAC